jgi:ABC-type nitrate/sulfonate/bicarbonate transport system substrate-binding protein
MGGVPAFHNDQGENMFNSKAHSHFSALSLAATALIVCSGTGCQPQKQTGPPEKVTIAYTTASNAILTYIAFAKGYFTEEGLEATPQPQAFGQRALNAVIEGKADLGTVADTPIMFAVMNGKKITILAMIQTSNKNEGIVARVDRGITEPSDLKGRTIGVKLGTASDFFADTILIAHGIDRKQVNIVDIQPEEMATALGTGRVDAVSIWNPILIQLQKDLGNRGCTFYGDRLYTSIFCVAASQDFVKKYPEAIKKVLRALIKAETFVQHHPEESRRLVAEFIETDKALLDEIWDLYNYKVILNQALLVDLEDQTRWATKYRLTERTDMPNYLDYIYVDGLQAVKPEAVRIFR